MARLRRGKKKAKLGQVLLRGWGKKTRRSRTLQLKSPQPVPKRSKLKKPSRISLKISLQRKRKWVNETETPLQENPALIELPTQALTTELQQPTPAPVEVLPHTPDIMMPQVVSPQPALPPELQLSFGAFSLSSAELVKPNDQLKQSIEAFLLDQRSEHTRRAYGKDLKRFVMFLNARHFQQGPSDLNRTILIAYKESLLKEGLQHTTVDRHLATLKSFFRWLVEDGILFKSPADGVRFVNPKRLSTTIGFSDEEVKRVVAVPDLHSRVGSLHYAIMMVLFYCGLRRSELCSLRTTNLGTERNQRVLRIRGKGNAERVIVMIPPVWNAIRHLFYITRRDLSVDQPVFTPIRNNRTKDLKKGLDPSMIFYVVRKYAKLAGIANRVSPHSCRATAISNARDHQVPDRAIQEFAGWASPDMITRYDKRRTAVEESAAHAIYYGAENRILPQNLDAPVGASVSDEVAHRKETDQFITSALDKPDALSGSLESDSEPQTELK